MTSDVNVIIICWNALEYTRVTIDSLCTKTDIPFSLTLVDNGSSDGTLEYLKSIKTSEYLKCINIIHNDENMGVGYAYNQGLQVSIADNYKFSCFCNNDLFFSQGWLRTLINAAQSYDNVIAITPLRPSCTTKYSKNITSIKKLLSITETSNWREELENYMEMPVNNFEDFAKKISQANGRGTEIINFPNSLSTCVCLVKTDVFARLGYFADASFPKYGGEDIDMCWTLMKMGYDCAVCHDVYVHHFRGKSIKGLDRNKMLKISNRILFNKWRAEILNFLLNCKNIDRLLATDNEGEGWLLSQLNKDVDLKKELEDERKH